MTTKSLITVNNNLICAIDLETTGLIPDYHEIIQIAILPLDTNLEPRKDLPPFDFKIRPEYEERIDYEALRISKTDLQSIKDTGFSKQVVQSTFYSWFERLKIGVNKRIVPLGHNITQHDEPFLKEWLGGINNYNYYFHGHARDTMIIAAYMNDRAEFHAEQTPFPKLTLTELSKKLEIETLKELSHDALYDAYITAKCYRKLLIKLFNI